MPKSQAMCGSWVVDARQLVKVYSGATVVDRVDLRVGKGQCVGLLGPNGAGKSTTLKMLMGQVPPTSGDIRVLDYAIPKQAREMHRSLGVVPQSDTLDPDFTVSENLRTFASYFALSREVVAKRMESLLQFAALQQKAHAPIQVLSGGMQRRLSLIRALINDPQLLILDEPTTGLDPQARQHMWQRLRMLLKEGKTMLLTTHYMEEAERLCDHILIIHQGRIIAEGSPQQLIKQHINAYVIEIYTAGFEVPADWRRQPQIERAEHVGDTLFWYSNTPEPLLKRLQEQSAFRFHFRPADLEDVFLRLTGRDLLED